MLSIHRSGTKAWQKACAKLDQEELVELVGSRGAKKRVMCFFLFKGGRGFCGNLFECIMFS